MIIWPNFYLIPPEKIIEEQGIVSLWWKKIESCLESIVYVVTFYMILTMVFIEPYQIPTGSMEPTLHGSPSLFKGDRVFVLKWISKFYPFQRGEMLVFISPEDHKKFIVKRLVGLPGDKITISPPCVRINGKPLCSPPIFKKLHYTLPISLWLTRYRFGVSYPYQVPKNCYFVLGDNSDRSNDSRFWGPLPIQNVLGKVLIRTGALIVWPFDRAKIFYWNTKLKN